jgi:alkanesulfonate monooxygenase SsuD/methylene tetrahydromethanopterin reductase-like flavin-dependent oxidoreductase (luciferase family)
VPIVLAALAPGSIRLAGELADAWAPFLWARSRLGEGRALLEEGEARASAPSPTRIVAGVPVALGPDAASARRLAAWWLSTYVTRMGPLYPRMLGERFGMSEALAREVTLFGTYDEAPELLAAWSAAGVDALNLVLAPGRPEEELHAALDCGRRPSS